MKGLVVINAKINITEKSKDNMNKCGIYMIKNLINEKVYIGMTRNTFKKRLDEHMSGLKIHKHHNIHLQNSYNLYGGNSFEFIILEIISKQENNLKYFFARENDFMIYYNALSKDGYNIAFSKNKYYDLSKFDNKFLSKNIRQTIRNILYDKYTENDIIDTLLELETVGEMIEYFYDYIAENDDDFLGFIHFLDKHLIRKKANWKINSFSNDNCRINECIALDEFSGFCKYYKCNTSELNYFNKEDCNSGQNYIEELINEYYELKETWN